MLTPDQIRTLKPGPELDRAIKAALFFSGPPEWDALVASGMRPESSYSQFWPGLGLVVEEMERRGYCLIIEQEEPGGGYAAEFGHGPGKGIVVGLSNNRFMAVCRAALLALAAERAGRGEG